MSDFSVLVVDDEVDFVQMLLKRLRRRSVDCEGALSGRDALKRISDRRFDIVLLDMKLGDSDGNEILREVKRMAPATEVIILSGHASARAGREGLKRGACDYLIKPVEFESLLSRLRQAHGRRAGL